MRWWPWEKKREMTIKVDGLERIRQLEEEREYLFRNYKMQRDDNYRILENRTLREKLRAQKQGNRDLRKHYLSRLDDLVQIITTLDGVLKQQRERILELLQQTQVLEAQPCGHIGTAVTIIPAEFHEVIQVTNEKGEITWSRLIPREGNRFISPVLFDGTLPRKGSESAADSSDGDAPPSMPERPESP